MSSFAVIIAEYNPFHNGHAYHIAETRRHLPNHGIVVLMSGHWMQRGEPALLDKWSRAQTAVTCGADVVLELPLVYTLRSAEFFAKGAVAHLPLLSGAAYLSFGVESATCDQLQEALAIVQSSDFKNFFKQELTKGLSYSQAIPKALAHFSQFPLSANNLLALEYLKALQAQDNSVYPLPIMRCGASHHSLALATKQASASALRHYLLDQSKPLPLPPQITCHMPKQTIAAIESYQNSSQCFPSLTAFEKTLLGQLRQSQSQELKNIAGMSEGLEHAFQKQALKARNLSELLTQLKTRRYPLARLRRSLCCLLLHLTQQTVAEFDQTGPQYLRVLAFNDQGRSILQQLRETAQIPIITKVTHYLSSRKRSQSSLSLLQQMLAYDTYGTDWWSLAAEPPQISGGRDFIESPRYVRL